MSLHLKLYIKRLKDQLSKAPSMLSLHNSKGLCNTLLRPARTLFRVATNKVKVSTRLRRFNKFLILILKVYKHHGASYVIKWLKACHVCVQRKLSSKPMSSLRELERNLPLPRLINGLPSFIGSMDRKAIRDKNPSTIRLWLTILSVYRVLEAPSKPNLETITNASKANDKTVTWILNTSKNIILKNKMIRNVDDLKATRVHRTLASGPNFSNAYLSILTDAHAIYLDKDTFKAFCNYAIQTSSDEFLLFLRKVMSFNLRAISKLGDSWILKSKSVKTLNDLRSGKLAFKIEPAGKVRTFAICDIWTQSLLKPLHIDLFKLLERLPNDGTFDQDKSFERCRSKAKMYQCAFAFDLSSATDRLPIVLQAGIINLLYNHPFLGNYWRDLIAGRKFIIRSDLFPEIQNTELNYATGQPMGCLSSWAMLAVTHHFIMQVCAYRVHGSQTWFDKYEVLGDDIVIFDKDVALAYLDVMKELDVGINLSKSLTSESLETLEFAKRTSVDGVDVSGLSWKQLLSGNNNQGRTMFAYQMVRKGYIKSSNMLVRTMLNCHFRNLNAFLNDPKFGHYRKVLEVNLMSILGSFAEMQKVSLGTVVSLMIDPHKEARFFDIDTKVPVNMMLQLIFGIMEGKSPETIISRYESRREVVLYDNLLSTLSEHIFVLALDKWQVFLATYEDKLVEYALALVKPSDAYLFEINDDLYADLKFIAKTVAFTGRDVSLLSLGLDMFMQLKERHNKPYSIEEGNHYANLVDDFINSVEYSTKVRDVRTEHELPRLMLELGNAQSVGLESQFM